MREITFRGKRLDDGEWLQGDLRQFKAGMYIESFRADGCKLNYVVDPKTVGQFTGLTDKNGTKIFEGDIIKIEHSDYAFDGMSLEYRTERGVVAYDDWGMVGVVTKKYKGQNVWSDFFLVASLTDRIESWTFEILGNIYDNPELIGGADNG